MSDACDLGAVQPAAYWTLPFSSGAGVYDVASVAVDRAGNREGGIAIPSSPKAIVRAVSWAASLKVNTDTGTAAQDNAAFALGPDGTLFAVWNDSRAGNSDIYFRSRDPNTGAWSPEYKVNNDTGTTSQRTPDVSVDGSGSVYVVWADDRNSTTSTDIYFAKRSGSTWSANIKVSDAGDKTVQDSPAIAVTSGGVAVAVWSDKRAGQANIYSARLTAGSVTWSGNYRVTSNTIAAKASPDVALDSAGTAWAVWQDAATKAGDIYVASLAANSATWSANTPVSDDSISSGVDKAPRIGITSGNIPIVAYLDGRTTNAQVRVTKWANGSVWNQSIQLSDAPAKPSGGLALVVKPQAGVIVAWDDARSTSAVWGVQCEPTATGVTGWVPEKWNDTTSAAYRPALAANQLNVFLGWRDDATRNGDIRFRLRTPS